MQPELVPSTTINRLQSTIIILSPLHHTSQLFTTYGLLDAVALYIVRLLLLFCCPEAAAITSPCHPLQLHAFAEP